MFASSILMLVWPNMIQGGAFQWLVVYFNVSSITIFLFVTGSARLAALIANGGSEAIGPRVRSITAIFSAIMWSQFTLALLKLSIDQGYPSLGVFFWFIFTLAELYVAYRAILDVRNH
jgi:cbb3-type cytochrome oxidase subunit 3